MNNIVFQLGAAHTLWNVSQKILVKHFGNTSNEEDLGVWRTLSALGIAPEKVVQKKDFSAMLQHMQKAHEATLFYCLRVVMEKEHSPIHNLDPLKLPMKQWNDIINQCYERFCLPVARRLAAQKTTPKLMNLLI